MSDTHTIKTTDKGTFRYRGRSIEKCGREYLIRDNRGYGFDTFSCVHTACAWIDLLLDRGHIKDAMPR